MPEQDNTAPEPAKIIIDAAGHATAPVGTPIVVEYEGGERQGFVSDGNGKWVLPQSPLACAIDGGDEPQAGAASPEPAAPTVRAAVIELYEGVPRRDPAVDGYGSDVIVTRYGRINGAPISTFGCDIEITTGQNEATLVWMDLVAVTRRAASLADAAAMPPLAAPYPYASGAVLELFFDEHDTLGDVIHKGEHLYPCVGVRIGGEFVLLADEPVIVTRGRNRAQDDDEVDATIRVRVTFIAGRVTLTQEEPIPVDFTALGAAFGAAADELRSNLPGHVAPAPEFFDDQPRLAAGGLISADLDATDDLVPVMLSEGCRIPAPDTADHYPPPAVDAILASPPPYDNGGHLPSGVVTRTNYTGLPIEVTAAADFPTDQPASTE